MLNWFTCCKIAFLNIDSSSATKELEIITSNPLKEVPFYVAGNKQVRGFEMKGDVLVSF